MSPSPAVRSLVAKCAAHSKWAGIPDEKGRAAATEAAHQAANVDRFEREAREKFGDLPPEELARAAASLRSAHMARLALKSAAARRARSPRRREAGTADA